MTSSLLVLIENLTPREGEVMEHLAAGQSNAQIAVSLVITEETVKSHLHTIFGKLQVESRLDAVLTAQQLGMVAMRGQLSPESLALLAMHKAFPHALTELRRAGLVGK